MTWIFMSVSVWPGDCSQVTSTFTNIQQQYTCKHFDASLVMEQIAIDRYYCVISDISYPHPTWWRQQSASLAAVDEIGRWCYIAERLGWIEFLCFVLLVIYDFVSYIQLVTSGVSSHPHCAVSMQFFETVVRYDKFFNQEPQYIPDTLVRDYS